MKIKSGLSSMNSSYVLQLDKSLLSRNIKEASNLTEARQIVREAKKNFTIEDAKRIGEAIGIDWKKFDVEQFRMGLNVELEHGLVDSRTNVTNDDEIMTGKIALAHLNEFPDYYTRLEKMENEAEKYWESKS